MLSKVIPVIAVAMPPLFTATCRRGLWSMQSKMTLKPRLCVKTADNCNKSYCVIQWIARSTLWTTGAGPLIKAEFYTFGILRLPEHQTKKHQILVKHHILLLKSSSSVSSCLKYGLKRFGFLKQIDRIFYEFTGVINPREMLGKAEKSL